MDGEHIAVMDIYSMGDRATRLGAQRLVVGPEALALLRAMFAPYPSPPDAAVETLLGFPISDDEEVPDYGWQAHASDGRVVCAGRLTRHSHGCGEDLP